MPTTELFLVSFIHSLIPPYFHSFLHCITVLFIIFGGTTRKAVRRECVIPQIVCKSAYYKKGGAYIESAYY